METTVILLNWKGSNVTKLAEFVCMCVLMKLGLIQMKVSIENVYDEIN